MASCANPRCANEVVGRRTDAVYCSRQCSSQIRTAAYRARNIDHARAVWTRWSRTIEGTVTVLLNYARDRARRQNLPFSLGREFVKLRLEAGVCELSGLSLIRCAPGSYRTHPFAPSLDRINPSDGYTETNVRLIAFCVNRARSDFGDEVLFRMAKALTEKNTS